MIESIREKTLRRGWCCYAHMGTSQGRERDAGEKARERAIKHQSYSNFKRDDLQMKVSWVGPLGWIKSSRSSWGYEEWVSCQQMRQIRMGPISLHLHLSWTFLQWLFLDLECISEWTVAVKCLHEMEIVDYEWVIVGKNSWTGKHWHHSHCLR